MYSLEIIKEELTYKEQECGNFRQRYLLIDFMYSSLGRAAIKKFLNSGYTKIGIYGASVFGRCLYDCIKSIDSGLTIHVFDQNGKSDYFVNEKIYAPYDRLELDIMILTTPGHLFETISGGLKKSGYLDTVSIAAVLYPNAFVKKTGLSLSDCKSKKMVYLFDSEYKIITGIRKKALMQTKAFSDFGYNSYLISKVNNSIEIYDYDKGLFEFKGFSDTIDYYKRILDFLMEIKPDIIYVRKQYLLNMFVMDFYKTVKRRLPKSKMVLEIPTFPYDNELKGTLNEKYIESDKYYCEFLKECFDYSTNFNELDELLGIKSVKMFNGIDVDMIRMKSPREKSERLINLATATSMSRWNGYERLLTGIRNYYREDFNESGYKVYFKVAGEGPELGLYKRLTEEYGIGEYVKFYGDLQGKALDDFYDTADFGVMKFGLYKCDSSFSGGIRLCEFSAKGIPVIHAGKLPEACSDLPYATEFPNDESAIDVKKIIERYEGLADGHIEELRQYALDKFDWKIYIKRLLCAIGEEI